MESPTADSSNDYENFGRLSTFSRLEGGFANLGIHSSSNLRNRTRAVQTSRPSSKSAQKLREIIGCSNDQENQRHPNLDMILDCDNRISFDNLGDVYSQPSSESTDDDLMLSTPPPLVGKLFEDDIDEFRDDTAEWVAQVFQDEDCDVSDTDPLPPTMGAGHDKENRQAQEEYRRKNTRRVYDDDDGPKSERRPLGQMPLADWPTQVVVEAERKRVLEVAASTSTGSSSSSSTIGSRRFVRSLSPSRKGKERARSPEH